MKNLETKKVIALGVMGTICVLACVEGWITKSIPAEFLALGSAITGYYFGYGKGKDDGNV